MGRSFGINAKARQRSTKFYRQRFGKQLKSPFECPKCGGMTRSHVAANTLDVEFIKDKLGRKIQGVAVCSACGSRDEFLPLRFGQATQEVDLFISMKERLENARLVQPLSRELIEENKIPATY